MLLSCHDHRDQEKLKMNKNGRQLLNLFPPLSSGNDTVGQQGFLSLAASALYFGGLPCVPHSKKIKHWVKKIYIYMLPFSTIIFKLRLLAELH